MGVKNPYERCDSLASEFRRMSQHSDFAPKPKGPIQNGAALAGADGYPTELSALIAFASFALCCATFIVAVTRVHNFWDMSRIHGDNAGYLTIAQATLEWRFDGPDLQNVRYLYRGTAYCVALVSKLTSLPVARCLPLVTMACGALGLYFCGRLWGWRVATLFAFINVAYTQRVCLGGCESIFVVFLFASLWLWRKQHTLGAMTCAALALWTRPTGVFLPVALGAVLLWHRRWRDLLRSALVVAFLGALYLIPIIFAAKDPLAPVNGYADDWSGASPITLPFYPLVHEALTGGWPWTYILKNSIYVALTVFGVVTLWKRRREAFADVAGQVESAFFLLFAAFCVSYNSNWAFAEYPRFSTPIIPQSVIGLRSRLLHSWVILPMSVVAGLLSAVSALNVRAVFHMLLH
jgi:hypothetical protein